MTEATMIVDVESSSQFFQDQFVKGGVVMSKPDRETRIEELIQELRQFGLEVSVRKKLDPNSLAYRTVCPTELPGISFNIKDDLLSKAFDALEKQSPDEKARINAYLLRIAKEAGPGGP